MKKLAALLIGVGALISGCAHFETSNHNQTNQDESMDRNRNGVVDDLERKALPLEPVIDRSLKSSD